MATSPSVQLQAGVGAGSAYQGLTDREREALALIAEGRSNWSTAERLGISTKTLEGMSGTTFSKLRLRMIQT
jgi:DNA-binding CsgD family transcriptional regulator